MDWQKLLVVASCVYIAFFAAAVSLTRATSCRVVGAVAVAVAGVGVESWRLG
jgi:hypothetical protein